jgi:hypothetical protein
MLERMQAHKTFVDNEKEAIIAELQPKFAEERKETGSGAERLKACEQFLAHTTKLLFEMLPYVPRAASIN